MKILLMLLGLFAYPAMADISEFIFSQSTLGDRYSHIGCCQTGTDPLSFSGPGIGTFVTVIGPGPGTGFAEDEDIDFRTGTLIGSTPDSWIFASGGSISVGGVGLPGVFLPLVGQAECTTVGGSFFGGQGCLVGSFTGGTFTGPVTMTQTGDDLDVRGSVAVTIDPSLADVYGSPHGLYTGTLTLSFADPSLPNVMPPGGFDFDGMGAGLYNSRLLVAAVPEPTSLLLLASFLAGLAGISRKTLRNRAHSCRE
jgi:hypothetical protein